MLFKAKKPVWKSIGVAQNVPLTPNFKALCGGARGPTPVAGLRGPRGPREVMHRRNLPRQHRQPLQPLQPAQQRTCPLVDDPRLQRIGGGQSGGEDEGGLDRDLVRVETAVVGGREGGREEEGGEGDRRVSE